MLLRKNLAQVPPVSGASDVSRPQLSGRTLAALGKLGPAPKCIPNADSDDTSTTYPLLRVIASIPKETNLSALVPHSKDEMHFDPGDHPLCAMNWEYIEIWADDGVLQGVRDNFAKRKRRNDKADAELRKHARPPSSDRVATSTASKRKKPRIGSSGSTAHAHGKAPKDTSGKRKQTLGPQARSSGRKSVAGPASSLKALGRIPKNKNSPAHPPGIGSVWPQSPSGLTQARSQQNRLPISSGPPTAGPSGLGRAEKDEEVPRAADTYYGNWESTHRGWGPDSSSLSRYEQNEIFSTPPRSASCTSPPPSTPGSTASYGSGHRPWGGWESSVQYKDDYGEREGNPFLLPGIDYQASLEYWSGPDEHWHQQESSDYPQGTERTQGDFDPGYDEHRGRNQTRGAWGGRRDGRDRRR
ncbi:hypothetical protein C8J57DRAFT_1724789 [Mycena rebaudengoi]|nr:hypothetical protein C8J57DRAFT_1724789 [Mycena rebaudengoi]